MTNLKKSLKIFTYIINYSYYYLYYKLNNGFKILDNKNFLLLFKNFNIYCISPNFGKYTIAFNLILNLIIRIMFFNFFFYNIDSALCTPRNADINSEHFINMYANSYKSFENNFTELSNSKNSSEFLEAYNNFYSHLKEFQNLLFPEKEEFTKLQAYFLEQNMSAFLEFTKPKSDILNELNDIEKTSFENIKSLINNVITDFKTRNNLSLTEPMLPSDVMEALNENNINWPVVLLEFGMIDEDDIEYDENGSIVSEGDNSAGEESSSSEDSKCNKFKNKRHRDYDSDNDSDNNVHKKFRRITLPQINNQSIIKK